mgnify:CR=1 FL=1
MTLILAVIPVLLLIILMAFFKMSGDKSSIISLIVTMLIALFGFAFSVDNLFYSFLYGALKAVSPILIIILMAIFSYNVLLKTDMGIRRITGGDGRIRNGGCHPGSDSYQSGI